MEYTSRSVGNAGLSLGIIGTALGALNGAGGIAGMLGTNQRGPASSDPGDRPVTRYEMSLWQDINAKDTEIAQLRAEKYADAKASVLQAELNQNAVWVAGATATMGIMDEQIKKLSGITRMVIPDTNVVSIKTAAVAASDNSAAPSNG